MMPKKNPGLQAGLRETAGFSLVEVLITVSLFAILFTACFIVLLSGSKSWEINSTKMQVQQELRKAVDWIKEDMFDAGQSTITNVPADGSWYSTITFKVPTGVSGNAPVWSSSTTQFVLGGGATANQLQEITGGVTRILANKIQSLQFRRQSTSPGIVEVSVQAQKTSTKGTLVTMSTSFKVKLRN